MRPPTSAAKPITEATFRRIAASTGAPSALTPNSVTPGSIFRNPDTAG
jgi:hypothetical protein